MPEPQQPSSSTRVPLSPPVCAACGQQMRLVSTEPATRYTNINQLNYVCDCGETSHKLVADHD